MQGRRVRPGRVTRDAKQNSAGAMGWHLAVVPPFRTVADVLAHVLPQELSDQIAVFL